MIYDLLGGFGRVQFGHGRFPRYPVGAVVFCPGGAVNQQRARINSHCHISDLVLGHLHVCKRLTEQLPCSAVFQRFVQRTPGKTQRGSADSGTKHIQGGHGDFKTFTGPAQQFCFRHPAIAEPQARQGVRGDDFDPFGYFQPWRPGIDDQGAQPACAGFLPGPDEQGIEIGNASV